MSFRCSYSLDVQVDSRAHGGADGQALHVVTFYRSWTSLLNGIENSEQVLFQFIFVEGYLADDNLYVAGFIGTILYLAAFDFVDSFCNVHGYGANLRVWHEAFRSEYTAQTANNSHHVRCTDTATALASSVGSLFGSGKMKSLERRNEDLQDRILELEDEARQRERQQAEQIQEIRNAYEQQHRKLSEFTDFVRRYFPYVEKLIPVVNFLRERLGFNDGIIRRLCEFKEVGIKGKLYSSEFNRSFDTRHSVCSIKQDESGKFDFKIDGVSHVNWFRKKMNEFREAMGIPKQKQDRGIKL